MSTEAEIEETYQLQQDPQTRLRAILTEKTWFGFDLDDTLHEFRRSSGKAINQVFEDISGRYGTPVPALRDEYMKILKEKTAGAFSDGKTSFDYRRERFSSLLAHFFLPVDSQFMDELLNSYETTLMASLELKKGPQDAQERAVKGLGIDGHIDFLATTNHFRTAKTDDLFPRVLEHLGISAGDIAYIGDNVQRDMEPAMAAGIFSIHLAEKESESLGSSPPRIDTLKKLHYILEDNIP
ncbi:hypothetical protein M426DRAFT_76559 [Hypoxylon sp. CI-4A]|nr:hypothetical protein M426DRAFT_76559 [Hypoxylon sp. CI-4A]